MRRAEEAAFPLELFRKIVVVEPGVTVGQAAVRAVFAPAVFSLEKDEVAFAAFGGWDAYGAKSFGYPTYWVNRFNLPVEKLGLPPDATSNDFAGLLRFVLGE